MRADAPDSNRSRALTPESRNLDRVFRQVFWLISPPERLPTKSQWLRFPGSARITAAGTVTESHGIPCWGGANFRHRKRR